MSAPASHASGPRWLRVSVITVRCPSLVTWWPPAVVNPGERVSQVNERPGSTSVTRQRAAGRRGWRTMASLPTRSGPASVRRTSRMLGVSSGQRSRSVSSVQTVPAGASTAAVT